MTSETPLLDQVIHTYDQDRFPFVRRVRDMFGDADLARIDESCAVHPKPGTTDQATEAHARFYAEFDSIRGLYHDFLRTHVLPLFTGDVCVQAVPTFRVCPPGGVAVSTFHRDADFHHQPGTVNFWLPLTRAFGTNSIWIESAPGRADYQPVELVPGEVLQFDAINLRHGNLANDTGACRVSFDFRVIPLDRFQDTGLSTVTSATPMRIGAYYMVMENPPER
ncbi:hypothetical protein ACTOB_006476 [Actinoplanes oblitus]|uniref:2OG-Fe(II) oxygenase n=1 Tax=Actinoplanes oblitus TaxID=3040509 RepID=A0ABY8WBX7_9ACTN|nr:hypothetical protein [Actinoplanes oblitus]WIM94452.1 hypothetical protein ACTOB_006476 [Actinoplanes oblitus]